MTVLMPDNEAVVIQIKLLLQFKQKAMFRVDML